MKHLLLTLALISAVPAMAAEENDTTIHYANKQIVLSTDSVSLNVAVYNNDGSTLVKTKETSFVDGQEVERFFVSSPFVPVRKKSGRTFYGSLPDFYIGVNLLNGGKEMHSQDVKSLEWGTTFFQVGVGLNSSNTLGIVSGFQFGFVHNHFQTNYMLDDNDGTPIIVKNPAEKVKTSFIKYTYWKVPIMLEWRNLNPSKLVFLGLGCSFDIKGNIKSKYRINSKRYTVSRNLDTNPVGVNLEAYLGFKTFSLYAHYSLTKLMNSGPACHPFGIGVGLTL
ncbi:hypothetical protein BWX39_08835 [Prevotella intermedia ATCC 25611 = DSM 20706]|uniref:outer membrane beta-barrel protein n=1 Tax=Prevotella intermedia TaxID=28131 RepID=UPI0004083C23|nr:outer membrane beta-barrel protein [Prevotella intermedia]APW33324.1 hypothetical protein BWX39_08835 [Prevotella intermedia ATCC 25611 = DSM 20706]SUB98032.1 Uncharacterised protein [Prevotella intermedia]